MYTVDLLRGEGIPIRSRPAGIAFACMIIVVPLLVAIGMVGLYLDRQVTLSIQSQQLTRLQRVLGTLSGPVEKKRALEGQRATASSVLADVKTALGRHTQWTGVLGVVVESMPDALVLTKLEAREEFVRRKVPSKEDPKTMVDVPVPVRTLEIGVCGRDKSTASQAVRDLQERLRSSASLGPRLDAVTVSQESGTLDGQQVVSCQLNCVFKSPF